MSGEILTPEEFPWMPIALGELGIGEIPGAGDAPRVVEYLKTTTLPVELAEQDETAWCSAFVNWCIEQAGLRGTRSAAARSWLSWGKPLQVPRRGCIAVFSRGVAPQAHVAFYIRTKPVGAGAGYHTVLGGNQNDRVGFADYDRERLLGFRVPA